MSSQVEIAGRYQRRGTLGTGAGTVVYEAFDRLIERRVAVKVVTLPPVDDPETAEAIARFRRGARAAGGLGHPNIVAVFDYGENAEEAWIVMELVDGGSLKGLLDGGERLSIGRIVQIMTQLLEGLGYSHAKGVVHRDIKPANIMLTPAGAVKIADFGIARLENSSMTHVGTMIGTPAYMAPEQLRGEVVDQRADIWAAGVVLYQLLTGEKPFGGGITSIMQKALYTEPVPPSRMRPQTAIAPQGTPGVATGMVDFDAVVARAMAKLPADRFASAADFAAALRQAADGPGPALAEAARSLAAGGQRPAALDDGTVVHPRPPRHQAAAPRSRVPLLAAGAAVVALAVAGGFFLTRGQRPDAAPSGRVAEAAPPAPPAPPQAAPPQAAPHQAAPPHLAAPAVAPPPAVPPPVAPQPAPPRAAEVQPAPPPPVAPQPALPSPAEPRAVAAAPPQPDLATVASVIRALPCSLLKVGQPGRLLTVSGIALAAEAEAMQRGIEAYGIPPASLRLSVESFNAPYCETLGLIRPVAALGDDAPGFAFTSPNPLRGGQPLRFTVATPAWAARLHVAYVTATGEVGHLVQGGAPFHAATTVPFGEAGRWAATAPFGVDMLVIIASEAPLFAQRRRSERLEEFNIALNGALRDAQAGGRVAARAVLVHTVAGP